AFAHTFKFTDGYHCFRDRSASDASYLSHSYIDPHATFDETGYWAIDNSVGIELLEGFKKWAKFGIAAWLRHQVARYTQTPDTITAPTDGLTPYPLDSRLRRHTTENRVWAGGRIGKQLGAIIRYNAEAEIGLIGSAAGDLRISGDLSTKFPLRRDSMEVRAYARFSNELPSFFLRRYQSNHFVWRNDFGRTRRLRFGGAIDIAASGTTLSAGLENAQNLIYFDSEAMPRQCGSNVQIFSATLDQHLGFGIWHWDNVVTYQVASDRSVLRLPVLSVYSNMYLLFRLATLRVQIGVDCQYMTRYKALAYQPATMSFYNQDEGIMVGDYPLCNAYANMKLGKVRFFVMCSHVNRGLFGGNNYFSTAHNPVNPRRFQLGLTVDFAN
ncbi:MAG: putative porin, partial [Muribaculaceae bacterium]|nr:putative porin [Muribaculaceae bacterium]